MSPDPPPAPAPAPAPGSGDVDLRGGHQHHHPQDNHNEQIKVEAQSRRHVAFHTDDLSDSNDPTTIAVGDPDLNSKLPTSSTKPTIGLHSPPDSNNVDGSTDSELSDLDEAIANADDIKLDTPSPALPADTQHGPDFAYASATAEGAPQPAQPEQAPTPEEDEDIGEVLPDHWSGNVPIFKPTMDQFKDFKKFVCRAPPFIGLTLLLLTHNFTDGSS